VSRRIPPWTFLTRKGRAVVLLGDREYPVDPTRPPAYFFPTYLQRLLPSTWLEVQEGLQDSEKHPLARWLSEFRAFLLRFSELDDDRAFRDVLNANATTLIVVGYDMYSLDRDRKLQSSLISRLTEAVSFQGALHEISVAATMIRAGFDIEFEDELDSSRKHPEFVATHRKSGIRVAVEAKSIHRAGVLGSRSGNPPPTVSTARPHKMAAQVCGQVERALPKAHDHPLYVFVDLNLPPEVIDAHAEAFVEEFKLILPQVDTGCDNHGGFVGRTMNLLVVSNRPMYIGEKKHAGGDTLHLFVNPPSQDCRFPGGSHHIDDVKAAIKQYGTVPS
jgi:hypothetical protein